MHSLGGDRRTKNTIIKGQLLHFKYFQCIEEKILRTHKSRKVYTADII